MSSSSANRIVISDSKNINQSIKNGFKEVLTPEEFEDSDIQEYFRFITNQIINLENKLYSFALMDDGVASYKSIKYELDKAHTDLLEGTGEFAKFKRFTQPAFKTARSKLDRHYSYKILHYMANNFHNLLPQAIGGRRKSKKNRKNKKIKKSRKVRRSS
jgi:hypothetical protein